MIKPHDYLVLIRMGVGADDNVYRFHLEVTASDENTAKAEALKMTQDEYPRYTVHVVDCHRIHDDPPVRWLEWLTNLFKR